MFGYIIDIKHHYFKQTTWKKLKLLGCINVGVTTCGNTTMCGL